MLITILAFLLVLGVLIFVHELGHFATAKLVDIEVPRFSIGLGPKMFGFRRGETEYVISWLPLGGYVKMAGMEEMERIEGRSEGSSTTGIVPPLDAGLTSEEPRPPGPRDFEAKSLPARALVISAGVIMNTLFALFAFAAMALIWGIRVAPESRVAEVHAEALPAGTEALAAIPHNARVVAVGDKSVGDWQELQQALAMAPAGRTTVHVQDASPIVIELPSADSARRSLLGALEPMLPAIIGEVGVGMPAEAAGLRVGDRVVEAGGQALRSWADLVDAIENSAGQPVPLVVERGGERLELTVTPEPPSRADLAAGAAAKPRIGIAPAAPRSRVGPIRAAAYGVDQTWSWITQTVQFLGQLFVGKQSPRNLGGPIMIAQVSGQVVRAGGEALLTLMAILSINLAVLNLLPIPILDGGHLVFLAIEAVRGRALSINQRMRATQIGFVMVLAIMVWALANDVLRLFGV